MSDEAEIAGRHTATIEQALRRATDWIRNGTVSGIHPTYGLTAGEMADELDAISTAIRSRSDLRVGYLRELVEANAMRAALERICQMADHVRQLEDADSYRDGMKEGLSRARTVAWNALKATPITTAGDMG